MYSRTGDDNEIKREIVNRVLGGWVLVSGSQHLIEQFERIVFPPMTEKNSDFLLYMGESLSRKKGRIGHLYLARKNEDLYKFLLHYDKSLTEEQWERAIEVRLESVSLPDIDMALVITFAKDPSSTPNEVKGLIENLVNLEKY